jgi:hypothetical protein
MIRFDGIYVCRALHTGWSSRTSSDSLQLDRLPRSLPSFASPDVDSPWPVRFVCLVRIVCTLSFVHQTQGDMDHNDVACAAAASAVVTLLQLVYAYLGPIRSLLRSGTDNNAARTVWVQLCCWLFCPSAGIAVAVYFGVAWAGGLPYAPALLDVWKGVSVLAAEASEVIPSSFIL